MFVNWGVFLGFCSRTFSGGVEGPLGYSGRSLYTCSFQRFSIFQMAFSWKHVYFGCFGRYCNSETMRVFGDADVPIHRAPNTKIKKILNLLQTPQGRKSLQNPRKSLQNQGTLGLFLGAMHLLSFGAWSSRG